MGLIAAAVRLRDGMATFESAAISGPTGRAVRPSREPSLTWPASSSSATRRPPGRDTATAGAATRRSTPPGRAAAAELAARARHDPGARHAHRHEPVAPRAGDRDRHRRRGRASSASRSTTAGARPTSGSPRASPSMSWSASRPTSPARSPTARPRSTGRAARRAADLADRVAAAWRELVEAGDDVVVVSHAGPLRIAIGSRDGPGARRSDRACPDRAARDPAAGDASAG